MGYHKIKTMIMFGLSLILFSSLSARAEVPLQIQLGETSSLLQQARTYWWGHTNSGTATPLEFPGNATASADQYWDHSTSDSLKNSGSINYQGESPGVLAFDIHHTMTVGGFLRSTGTLQITTGGNYLYQLSGSYQTTAANGKLEISLVDVNSGITLFENNQTGQALDVQTEAGQTGSYWGVLPAGTYDFQVVAEMSHGSAGSWENHSGSGMITLEILPLSLISTPAGSIKQSSHVPWWGHVESQTITPLPLLGEAAATASQANGNAPSYVNTGTITYQARTGGETELVSELELKEGGYTTSEATLPFMVLAQTDYEISGMYTTVNDLTTIIGDLDGQIELKNTDTDEIIFSNILEGLDVDVAGGSPTGSPVGILPAGNYQFYLRIRLMGGVSWDGALGFHAVANGSTLLKLVPAYPSPFMLSSPVGGEAYYAGETISIEWTDDNQFGRIGFELSSDNGQTWQFLGYAFNTGVVTWEAPVLTSDQCLLRLRKAENPDICTVSPVPFIIYECSSKLAGDVNGDCVVDLWDLQVISSQWLNCAKPYGLCLDIP